jgi:hypothetical protein
MIKRAHDPILIQLNVSHSAMASANPSSSAQHVALTSRPYGRVHPNAHCYLSQRLAPLPAICVDDQASILALCHLI